jgi:hypothetical protein
MSKPNSCFGEVIFGAGRAGTAVGVCSVLWTGTRVAVPLAQPVPNAKAATSASASDRGEVLK